MSDNDEKILPVLRWLLIAFFGLLLVLALQLFLLVTRADAATTTIRVGYPQLNGGQIRFGTFPTTRSIGILRFMPGPKSKRCPTCAASSWSDNQSCFDYSP